MSTSTLKLPMFDPWKAARWSETEAIPAAEVLICWKYEIGRGVIDALVTPFPDDRHYFDHYWDGTSGACYRDWLEPGKTTMTPENVFGEMAASMGFASKEAAEKVIVMFSRIRECDWARKMLASDSYERLKKVGLLAHW